MSQGHRCKLNTSQLVESYHDYLIGPLNSPEQLKKESERSSHLLKATQPLVIESVLETVSLGSGPSDFPFFNLFLVFLFCFVFDETTEAQRREEAI